MKHGPPGPASFRMVVPATLETEALPAGKIDQYICKINEPALGGGNEELAMVRERNPGKTLMRLAKVIIRVGVLTWFGFLCLWVYYGFSRPTSKQPDSGSCIPWTPMVISLT